MSGPSDPPPPLVEGVDYYVEAGRWVFTAHFLRTRGYCCKNRCRHCPWGFTGRGEPPPPDAGATALTDPPD